MIKFTYSQYLKYIYMGFVLLLSSLAFTRVVCAQKIEGFLKKLNFDVCGCDIASMDVKYRLSTLMGEPVVNGSFQWTTKNGSEGTCLNSSTKIFLNVRGNNAAHGFITLSPTVPKAGSGYGFNTSGSPEWSELFCGTGGQEGDCLSKESAKALWKSGLTAIGFSVESDCSLSKGSKSVVSTDSKGNGSCSQQLLIRDRGGYEKYQCADCNIVYLKVSSNTQNQKTYDGI